MNLDNMLQVVFPDDRVRAYLKSLRTMKFTNRHLKQDEFCHHVTLYHPRSSPKMATDFHAALGFAATVSIVGIVTTSYVEAVLVVVNIIGKRTTAVQADGKRMLHVTIGCAPGVRPVAANDAILANPILPLYKTPLLSGTIIEATP